MKKMAIILLSTVLGNMLYADVSQSDTFVGIEIASTEVQGQQPSMTSDSISYGVRIGAENEEWRTIIGFNHYDKDNYAVEKLYLSVDYLFLKYDELEAFTVQPYIGLNTGYANYEQGSIDENGLVYGAQTGVVLNIIEQFDIDFSYRYSLSSADAFDHESDFLLGLHYHF